MLDLTEDRSPALVPAGNSFASDGFLGPVRLLDARQCRAVVTHLTSPNRAAPAVWKKGGAVTDWLLYQLGSDRRLLELLTPLLGDDIILWGTKLIFRNPGHIHTWHVDEETEAPDGRFVTAWIGLHNTTANSGIRMIAGSHLCNRTLSQFQADTGVLREDSTTETVLRWAQSENPEARLIEPAATDGEAIFFDGRMWHGSHNRLESDARFALILHFAAADCTVRIPSETEQKLAPAILVQGKAPPATNWLVPPPMQPLAKPLPALPSLVHQVGLPLADNAGGGWKHYPFFSGSTPVLESMTCHAAVLSPGYWPHPPHAHQEEELLMVLDGEADLLVADKPSHEGARPIRVKAGDFAYYRAFQHHSIRNPSSAPVTYMMFRWHGRTPAVGGERLRSGVFRNPAPAEAKGNQPFVVRNLFGAPTRWLGKFHCHTSRLEVGGGYAAHRDDYDVAILIQSGRVRTLGREAGPGSLIYYPKGELHGMRNAGDEPAHYIVFEFHGAAEAPIVRSAPPKPGCLVPPGGSSPEAAGGLVG